MPHRSKSTTKPDPPQPEALSHRRTKRLRIDSDEDEDEGYEQQERHTNYSESYARGHDSPDIGDGGKRPGGVTQSPDSYDEGEGDYAAGERVEGDGEYDGEGRDGYRHEHGEYEERPGKRRRSSTSSPSRMHNSPPPMVSGPSGSQGSRIRRTSIKASGLVSGSVAKKQDVKGKQKAQHLASTTANKRKKRLTEDEDEEEDFQDLDSDGDEVDLGGDDDDDEARFSDEYEEEDKRPSKGKRGRAGGKGGQGKEKAKEKDVAPILKKAKFEGSHASLASTNATKRPRTKKNTEDMLVDVVGDTGTPEPSSIGSPATSNLTAEGSKDENVTTSAQPPPKKPKLPTIKKLKSTGGTGSSTPSSTAATGSKPTAVPPPPASAATGSGVTKLGISESTKSTRPKTNATSDLDLSNPSLYAELFKNPAGNASKTGLNRRAKEEERRRELDKMRDEYKVKLLEEAKVSFDLQGQAEKIARFEEVLRGRHSSALYPNFLAAKWREEWEREKRRAHKREYQQHQQQTVDANGVKEEGEM